MKGSRSRADHSMQAAKHTAKRTGSIAMIVAAVIVLIVFNTLWIGELISSPDTEPGLFPIIYK